ncbi:MAG: hypothetical protein COB23_00510 [Methylophaga sp.]|nr:MAG: hypothetical protein COB23_00510 [Methylophaga sp.]
MRLFWMKLHAYLACFFLPLTVLYIFTGILHLFDIKGEVKNTFEYKIEISAGWPEQETVAKALVEHFLAKKNHFPLPESYYPEEGLHDWFGRKQEVLLLPTESPYQAKLVVKEHDFWLQLLLIHKGIAGKIFWILGLFFGIHLLISVISGVVLALQLPGLKSMSTLSLSGGFSLLVILLLT